MWFDELMGVSESRAKVYAHLAVKDGQLQNNVTGNSRVFLTLLGGGAFGNKTEWIIAAIRRALCLYQNVALDVQIVSYGSSKAEVRQLIAEFG